MPNIKCKACGKRYSYHESDLCPQCGAYNRPSGRLRVDFDQEGNAELLNEQQFQQQSTVNRRRKDCYEHETVHRSGKKSDSLPTGRNAAVKIALLMAVVAVVSILVVNAVSWFAGLRVIGVPESDLPENWDTAEAPAEEITADNVFYYAPGEQFVIDGETVIVESAALEENELRVTVQEEEASSNLSELYIAYANGSELLTYPWDMTPEAGNIWQYIYHDDGFGWEDVTGAYLIYSSYGEEESYYEVRVDITEVFH